MDTILFRPKKGVDPSPWASLLNKKYVFEYQDSVSGVRTFNDSNTQAALLTLQKYYRTDRVFPWL